MAAVNAGAEEKYRRRFLFAWVLERGFVPVVRSEMLCSKYFSNEYRRKNGH
jgi:hypothetical protein